MYTNNIVHFTLLSLKLHLPSCSIFPGLCKLYIFLVLVLSLSETEEMERRRRRKRRREGR